MGRFEAGKMLVSLRDSTQISFLRFTQAQTDLLILVPWPLVSAEGRELSLYIDWRKASWSQLIYSNSNIELLSCVCGLPRDESFLLDYCEDG